MKRHNDNLRFLFYSICLIAVLSLIPSVFALECVETYAGDGWCDASNNHNNESCAYDAGDCCASTCNVSADFTCGSAGYDCKDPYASDYVGLPPSEFSVPSGWTCDSFLYGDMTCDTDCGVEDTLDCTCEDLRYTGDEASCLATNYCSFVAGPGCIYLDGFYGDGTQVSPYSVTDGSECDDLGGVSAWINDGTCNFINLNMNECSYDGSDCDVCDISTLADAICDSANNIAECDYDGGDCGPSPDTTAPPSNTAVFEYYICNEVYRGDGWCDSDNNNAQCGYDDGDCCTQTCTGFFCMFEFFRPTSCIDPAVPGNPPLTTTVLFCSDFTSEGVCENYNNCYWDTNLASCETGEEPYIPQIGDDVPEWSADGWCDSNNNYAIFNWDGGDCCESTCVDGDYTCGSSGYDCKEIV